jgi:uncharacterized repeat protein (TIGR02543 family)
VYFGIATNIAAMPNTGYSFVDWTVVSGSGVSFGNANSASTTVTLSGGDAAIRANFALKTFSLSVNASSGGKISTPASSPITVGYGAATNIAATTNAGYSFVNWSIVSGSGVSFGNANSENTTVTLTSGDAVVQANFTNIQYSLSLETTTGGAISSPASSPVTVGFGAATSIIATANTYYAFVDWTVVSGTGVSFADANSASTTVTLSGGNATIQANFVMAKYWLTVTASTGGKITSPTTSPIQVGAGTATSIAAAPVTGYTFVDWTVTSGSGTSFADANSASTTVSLSSADASIQANFTPTVYNIGYNLDGGTNSAGNPATYTVASAAITLQAPSKSGYLFAGWFEDAGFTQPITTIPSGSTGSLALYAQWNKQVNGGTTIVQPSNYTVTISGPTTLHYGTQATFTSTYTGTAQSYAWYIDSPTNAVGSSSSVAITPTVQIYAYGSHLVMLVVTDADGISYSGILAISVGN